MTTTTTIYCESCGSPDYMHEGTCHNCGWDGETDDTCELTFQTAIAEILDEQSEILPTDTQIISVRTFEDAGMMTRNMGLVVRLSDGSEFQMTIVKSR